MKFKKIVSAVAALAMSASMFAGLAITADAATTSLYAPTAAEIVALDGFSVTASGDWITPTGLSNRASTTGTLASAVTSDIIEIKFDTKHSAYGGGVAFYDSNGNELVNAKFDNNSWAFTVNGVNVTSTTGMGRGDVMDVDLVIDMTTKTIISGTITNETDNKIDTSTLNGVSLVNTAASNVGKIALLPRSGNYNAGGNVHLANVSVNAVTADDVTISGMNEVEVSPTGTATLEYTALAKDNTTGAEWSSNITWGLAEEKTGVSIDPATGVLSIDGTQASDDTVTVTATWGGVTGTYDVAYMLASYTPVVTGVEITGEDITGYAEILAGDYTYTAKVLDQINAEMALENVVWSVSPVGSGVTVADGVVTISNTATAGTYTVTATSETDNAVSASKTITLSRVRDIEYSGIDMITPFGGYVSESTETGINKQQITGETIVMEYDIYVPTGDSSSFTFYNNGNLGTQYIFNDSDGDGWVTMQYKAGQNTYNINSSDAYTGFYADHWIHIKFEIPVTGNPGLGNTTISASTVDGDTGALNAGWRTPKNNRDISARNLSGRLLNKMSFSGGATMTNVVMYTKAADVTVDATNATVSGIEAGYIAQNTYTATVTADEGYTVSAVTVDGEAVTANEDGTYSIVVDGDTAVAVATEAIPTSAITVTAPNATVLGFTSDTVYYGTYTATITAALGYELGTVTVNGTPVEVADDGTCQIEVNSAETAIVVTTTAKTDTWVFEKIDLNDWATANIFFEYATPDVEGTTVVPSEVNAITITNFLSTYAGTDITEVTGDGEINFAITVLQDGENGEYLTDMWLKKAEGVVVLSTGAFDADAEMEESDYIELGTGEFDVE